MSLNKKRSKLACWICETAQLQEDTVKELYRFWCEHVITKLSWKDFHSEILLKYNTITLFRESLSGTLQAFVLRSVFRNKVAKDGTRYTLIPLAAAYFQPEFRRSTLLLNLFIWDLLKELLLHPFTPLYFGGRVFSYRGYLSMAQTVKCFYPNYQVRVPPELEKNIMDDQARTYLEEKEIYDSEKGIIYQEDTVVKDELSGIPNDQNILQNPHVKFFYEMNPGTKKGHQLCVIGKLTWRDLLNFLLRRLKLKSKL